MLSFSLILGRSWSQIRSRTKIKRLRVAGNHLCSLPPPPNTLFRHPGCIESCLPLNLMALF